MTALLRTLLVLAALVGVGVLCAAPADARQAGAPGQTGGSDVTPTPGVSDILLCRRLADVVPYALTPIRPAHCGCKGFVDLAVDDLRLGPVRIGVNSNPANGNLVASCHRVELHTPSYVSIAGAGPVNIVCRPLPIFAHHYRCNTGNCYWLFGSARCEYWRMDIAGYVNTCWAVGDCNQ